MSHVYQLRDGSPVFVSVAEGHEPPTQEQVQTNHDRLRAELAARTPEAIAYGRRVREAYVAKDLLLRGLSLATNISAVRLSRIVNGMEPPTAHEAEAIKRELGVTA